MSDWFFASLWSFARRVGIPTLSTVTLLALALSLCWLGIASAVREARSLPGMLVVLSGMALGWFLARRRVKGAWALLLGSISGIGLSLFVVGGLSIPLGAALGRLFSAIPGQSAWATLLASLELLWQGLVQVGRDATVLIARLIAWLPTLPGLEAVVDPVALALFWSLIVWGIGFWAGFGLRRTHQPLLALLPAGALLAGLTAYSGESVIYPLLLVCIYLALQILLAYFDRAEIWAEEQVDAPELHFEVAMAAIGVPFLLTALAVLTPSLSIRSLVEWWQRQPLPLQEESLARSLGIQRGSGEASAFQSAASTGLAREHLIGSGPELSEQPVLRASLAGLQLDAGGTPAAEDLPPLYWRLLTYDHYTGSGWLTSDFDEMAFNPGQSWVEQASDQEQGWVIRQIITKANAQNPALYIAGELLAASEPFRIARRSSQDLFAAQTDSRRYTADSILVASSVPNLQAAGSEYPEWVRANYLQLPDQISTRVTSLALELTAREPTPYDRAAAITRYLRTFPYTLEVPKPPLGSEISDYFLFELQRGYCDYFATSMVVLARAAGLPARLVIGYASGSWDAASQQFLVTEADAHSWVEVFFPDIGWVEFEPTSARPDIPRQDVPRFAQPEAAQGYLPPLVAERTLWQTWAGWLRYLAGTLFLLALGLALWVGFAWLRLQRLPPQALFDWQYRRLRLYGKRMGLGSSPGVTPLEFGALLNRALQVEANLTQGETATNADHQDLSRFVQIYSRAAYSRVPASPEEKAFALQSWRRLAPRLWWRGVVSRLSSRLARRGSKSP